MTAGYIFMRLGADFSAEVLDRLRTNVDKCLQRTGVLGCDAFLLLDVIEALIGNALEYGQATWMEVELQMHPEMDEVRFIFRDDGMLPPLGEGPTRTSHAAKFPPEEGSLLWGLDWARQTAHSWDYRRLKQGGVNELEFAIVLQGGSPIEAPSVFLAAYQ